MPVDDAELNGQLRMRIVAKMREEAFLYYLEPLLRLKGSMYEVLLDRLSALEGTSEAASITVLNAFVDATTEIQCLVGEYFYGLGLSEHEKPRAQVDHLSAVPESPDSAI